MLPELDAVIHAPARLRLMTVLSATGEDRELSFLQLQQLTGTTAGNLSTHLRKLEEVGYVAVSKTFVERTPVTRVALTAEGRRRLASYRADLAHYLDDAVVAELIGREGKP